MLTSVLKSIRRPLLASDLACNFAAPVAAQVTATVRLHLPFSAVLLAAFIALTGLSASQTAEAQLPAAAQQQQINRESGSTTRTDEPQQGHSQADGTPNASEANPPLLTMFRHPDGKRYWLSAQANIIYQGRLPFHSTYESTNTFRNSAEYKTSIVGTLYTGLRPTSSIRYNTDLILDFELVTGRGLSQALGLAGFTNLDVVRNPSLGPSPYIARYGFHQLIGLTNETIHQQAGVFAFAPEVPVRRLEFRGGKMSVPDFFDSNGPGSDSHLQFMNWTVDNNGAWDYAADTRGYTLGGMAEYDDRSWSIRYGIFAMPTVGNALALDWAFSRAHGQNIEFELRHSLVPQRKGVTRLLFYANRAHMGVYREAVDAFLDESDFIRSGVTAPTIALHEHTSALKYGFGYNTEQEITANLRVFGRFGWNEGQHESFAYTEVDQTIEGGFDYSGAQWNHPADRFGFALVSNAIKRDHQNYLRYGGLGFILGDGHLNYGRETIEEAYYTLHSWRGLYYSLDVQHINNPGYNRDRGPVWVGSVRAHVDF